MCGIIGITGKRAVAPLLLEGLRRLEYRGYDSAGIATAGKNGLARVRAEGKLANLDAALQAHPINGTTGIGHTRWATHGMPTERNAHPHMTPKVAVVHNGIIENFRTLRKELVDQGYTFGSDTDTEVVPILITSYLSQGLSPAEASAKALKRLEGAFALGIIFADSPELIIAARRGSPLAVGYGEGEMFMGSDAVALAPYTRQIAYLEEGDWAEIRPLSIVIHDASDAVVERNVTISSYSSATLGKGNYRHFMQKEIYDQPSVLGECLNVFYHPASGDIRLPALPFALGDISQITLVACGTSYYAAMVAKYWIERLAKVPVEVDIASEFRYRTPVLREKGLAIFISQSGETADTLAAMRLAKAQSQHCLAVINVPESSMAQEAEAALPIHAGPEIGVASTKAFTAQLMTLACFTLALGEARGVLPAGEKQRLAHALAELPASVSEVLHHDEQLAAIAATLIHARDVLYLGRGTSYPIALEGALKLKEISYIHAEGYAAGEMKHGPIALIDEDVPIIAIAPHDQWFDKTASNLQEAHARGGKIILLSDGKGLAALSDLAQETFRLPECDPFVAPLLYAIPVQLLAYHVAVLRGTDVDQPRNLAKSVTVE